MAGLALEPGTAKDMSNKVKLLEEDCESHKWWTYNSAMQNQRHLGLRAAHG